MLDSLLDQVDWLEVAIKVAKKRAPSVYCNAIEQILLAHIYQLVKAEGEGDDLVGFESGNDEKNYVHVFENDEDEGSSEFARKSEDEDGDYDGNDDEHMKEDKDEDDDEDDKLDEDKSDEDSEYDTV